MARFPLGHGHEIRGGKVGSDRPVEASLVRMHSGGFPARCPCPTKGRVFHRMPLGRDASTPWANPWVTPPTPPSFCQHLPCWHPFHTRGQPWVRPHIFLTKLYVPYLHHGFKRDEKKKMKKCSAPHSCPMTHLFLSKTKRLGHYSHMGRLDSFQHFLCGLNHHWP